MSRSLKISLVIIIVLILDQALKIWVKTHMNYDDTILIFGLKWAKLRFVENDGMAFGLELGGVYGKYALSIFRIIAVAFLLTYLRRLARSGASMGLLISFALVLAGALGNIIDSAFYGMIFAESPYHGGIAELFPAGGGYSSFLRGKVVDMFYFEIARGYFPAWFPFWQGEEYVFFRPVFNVADAAITTGVASIILFHRRFFNQLEEAEKKREAEKQEAAKASVVIDKPPAVVPDEAPEIEEEPRSGEEEE